MEKQTRQIKLGINGLGRIGKLSLWHHVAEKSFSEIVVNLGREAGLGLNDIASYIEKDSSYGRLSSYIYGRSGGRIIEELNENQGTMLIDGIPVKILRKNRNPKDIAWSSEGVNLVVDTTGVFSDPTVLPDSSKGSLRGHLEGGATKVVLSAPFKIKDKALSMPEDAVTMVMGINEDVYDPSKHNVISAASCTTTCLAYMVKPLLDHFSVSRILTASMVTVHASTGSQVVLDRVPGAGAKDLRKNRSIFNNIILTTTGAAKALGLVIPEMKKIGFIAESVRIPTTTGSLIVLVVTMQDENSENPINRTIINDIYRNASDGPMKGRLFFTEEQNVSGDIIGLPEAACVIEGTENHTRTAFIEVDPALACSGIEKAGITCSKIQIPITQVVIYGWYDNELGSYTNMLGDLICMVADSMI